VDVHWAEVCNSLPLIGKETNSLCIRNTDKDSLCIRNTDKDSITYYHRYLKYSFYILKSINENSHHLLYSWFLFSLFLRYLRYLEELSEDPTFPSADLAAAVASKCFYHLQGKKGNHIGWKEGKWKKWENRKLKVSRDLNWWDCRRFRKRKRKAKRTERRGEEWSIKWLKEKCEVKEMKWNYTTPGIFIEWLGFDYRIKD
jgi:hypothetical protein